MNMQVIHKDGEWYVNLGAFRMHDPENNHIFESGVKYKIRPSEWMKGQDPNVIKKTDVEEEVEALLPHQTGDQIIGTKPEEEPAAPEAPAKPASTKK